MKKLILVVLASQVALTPCFADIIPTRYGEKDPSARDTVKVRLEGLGLTADQADQRVKRLTSDELAFFAGDTDRIQPAGGLYWYEWLIGIPVVLLGIYLVRIYQTPVDRP